MAPSSVIGNNIKRVDAFEKVTGKAKYCSDFKMPDMLFARIVRSAYAHAKILRIDISQAEKLPGVRTIVVPEDVPDMRFGYTIYDEYILPRDNIVRCIGQPVAIVVADSLEIADEAADLVEVDCEELPAIFDPEEAMLPDPPAIVHPEMREGFVSPRIPFSFDPSKPNCVIHYKVRKGDVDKGFAEADLVVENRYSTARIAHCCLETHRADAWVEGDGTLAVRIPTQLPSTVQSGLATLFGVSPAKVRIVTPYIGGAFGGKVGDETLLAPLALIASMKSGRPVRLINTRAEEFIEGRHRADVVTYIKDGIKKDGTLVAREMRVTLNIGRHAGVGYLVSRNMLFGAVGTYRLPNFKWDGYGVYTNNPVVGAFRGFGSPEIVWAVEQQMDQLAEKSGIDPVEIRRKNILKEGEKDACGQTVVSIGAAACLDKAAEWIGWGKNSTSEGPWKIGKGIGLGNKYSTTLPSCATVKVFSDGAVEVYHGNVEIGQGLNTVMTQIAAEEFGIPVSQVKVVHGDTLLCPSDYGAVSSRSTFFTGNAVRLACRDAKRRIFELASVKLGVSADTLDIKDNRVFVVAEPGKSIGIGDLFMWQEMPLKGGEIIGTDCFFVPTVPADRETGQSPRMVTSFSHFAHAVEVAVNVETGAVKVLRIVTAADGGTVINPKMAEGQLEGGFQQGIGSCIFEEIALDNGVVTNANFADYTMPTAREMPLNSNVKGIMSPAPHPEGPFGAKGLGEGVIAAVAPAISNAVYNAVGIRVKDLPISREKVFQALRERRRG